jgi:predicted Rossmann fold flavoprotein
LHQPRRFVTDSPPRLVQRFLRSWPIRAQREFFENEVGIPLALEAESRKWFPASNRARDVRDGLVALAQRRGVEFQFGTEVRGLGPSSSGWQLDTAAGDIPAATVVIATGGRSVPATGSTGTGFTIAAGLGHRVHETYAALTPLLAASSPHAHLSGVSLTAAVRAESPNGRTDAHGGFLFTHRGYSGPAVLDVSHVVARLAPDAGAAATIRVRWSDLTDAEWHETLRASTGNVVNVLAKYLPQRLADRLVAESGLPADRRVAELRRDERTSLVERLVRYDLAWSGHEGYAKAEVTGGGVALDELDPRTLESARHKGLFFCGEVLDAFGPIGGHNFAWAWATGRLAGLGAGDFTVQAQATTT